MALHICALRDLPTEFTTEKAAQWVWIISVFASFSAHRSLNMFALCFWDADIWHVLATFPDTNPSLYVAVPETEYECAGCFLMGELAVSRQKQWEPSNQFHPFGVRNIMSAFDFIYFVTMACFSCDAYKPHVKCFVILT